MFIWFLKQNQKGLVVKYKYLMFNALNIAVELDTEVFAYSKWYFSRIKRRNVLLTSRAHTLSQILPSHTNELAVEFI